MPIQLKFGMIYILLCSILALLNNGKAKASFFSALLNLVALFLRQSSFGRKYGKCFCTIVYLASFFVLSEYENYFSSRLIVSPEAKRFDSVPELVKEGFKINYRSSEKGFGRRILNEACELMNASLDSRRCQEEIGQNFIDNGRGQHSKKLLEGAKVAGIFADKLTPGALKFFDETIITQSRVVLALSNSTYRDKAIALRCNSKMDAFYHTLFYRMVTGPFSREIRDVEKLLVASGIVEKFPEWANYEFIVGPYMRALFFYSINLEK